jgi:hypothetical protein
MSLYPGNPRKLADGRYVLDDTALTNSMAEAIEEEMAYVYKKIKGSSLPDAGQEDRRLLFVAIARGVLKYLAEHQEAIDALPGAGASAHTHDVTLNVTLNKHTKHS